MSDGYGPLGDMQPVDGGSGASSSAAPPAVTNPSSSGASSSLAAESKETEARQQSFANKSKTAAVEAGVNAKQKAAAYAESKKPTKQQQQAAASSVQTHSKAAQSMLEQHKSLLDTASPGTYDRLMGAAGVLGAGAGMFSQKLESQPDDVEAVVDVPEFDLDGNPLSDADKARYIAENKKYAEQKAKLDRITGANKSSDGETMVSAQAGFGFADVAKDPAQIEAEKAQREAERKKKEEEEAAAAQQAQVDQGKEALGMAGQLYAAWTGGSPQSSEGSAPTPGASMNKPAATSSHQPKVTGGTRGPKVEEPPEEEDGFIPNIPLPRHLVEKGSAPPAVVEQVAKQTMRGEELTVSEEKQKRMEEEAAQHAAAQQAAAEQANPMMAMVAKYLPFLGLQVEGQLGAMMNTDIMIRIKCDDGVQLMAKATRDMNIADLKDAVVKTYCEKQFGSYEDAPEDYKIVAFHDEQGFEMVDSFRVTDVLKSGDVVEVCIVPANAGGDETKITRPGIHPVGLDTSTPGYVRYVGTPDVDPPFPGFYIGFDAIKNPLSAYVKSVQAPRANESHPPLLILGGVKTGKTTTLRTLLPSYVYASDRLRRTRFLLLDCSNTSGSDATGVFREFFFLLRGALADAFHGDMLEGTMAAALSGSTADANVFKEASFDILRTLNRLAHKTIILIDELQQLFQVPADAAKEVGIFLKSILSHPMLVNVRFALASTTTPAFLQCLQNMPSNGSDILRSAVKIVLPATMTPAALKTSREALVALHNIPDEIAPVLFDPRLHGSPAQHAAVAGAYLLQDATDPNASVLEKASAAVEYVHEQIASVLKRDLEWLHSSDSSALALWTELVRGEATKGASWLTMLVRLGVLTRQKGGKIRYSDPILRYYLESHKIEGGKLVPKYPSGSYVIDTGFARLAGAELDKSTGGDRDALHHNALKATNTLIDTQLYEVFPDPQPRDHELDFARGLLHEVLALPANKAVRKKYLDGKTGEERPWFYALARALGDGYSAATTDVQKESLFASVATHVDAHSLLPFLLAWSAEPMVMPVLPPVADKNAGVPATSTPSDAATDGSTV